LLGTDDIQINEDMKNILDDFTEDLEHFEKFSNHFKKYGTLYISGKETEFSLFLSKLQKL
jgi:hypothetical protein